MPRFGFPALMFVAAVSSGTFAAQIDLQNAADGSSVLDLPPNSSADFNIVIITSAVDSTQISFVNAYLDTNDNDNIEVSSATGGQPWTYDRSSFHFPAELDEAGGNEYGLVSGSSDGSGKLPLGSATHIIDTLTISSGETSGSTLVTFELGARQPQVFGPPPTYTPFTVAPPGFPAGFPGFLYIGDANSNNSAFEITYNGSLSDCNENGISDADDIASGFSLDCNNNSTPDECELGADYTLLVGSSVTDNVLAFDTITGNPLGEAIPAGTGGLEYSNSIVRDDAGNIYVSSVGNNSVIKVDETTQQVVMTYSSSLLIAPTGLKIQGDSLLVGSYVNDSVVEFNIADGSLVGQFIPPGAGGLNGPETIVQSPSGHLLIPSFGSDQVLEFDAQSGAFVRIAAGGHGLDGPTDVLFLGDSSFLVSSVVTDSVLRFDNDGEFLGEVIAPGSGGLNGPECMVLDPFGQLLVSSIFSSQILRYDLDSGEFLGVFADSDVLDSPTYMFVYSVATSGSDCNLNGIPDDCDLASGISSDCNFSGVPDECEADPADCNGNGESDFCDITVGGSFDFNENGVPDECDPDCQDNSLPDFLEIIFGFSLDCNFNTVPDDCDLDDGTSADCNLNDVPDECDIVDPEGDCNLNGVPDECEPNCNDNGKPDECDIASGFSNDCNGNAIPDECDLGTGVSRDCNSNEVPDECEVPPLGPPNADCNTNSIPDECDLANGISRDCQENDVPDECEIADGTSKDVNDNGVPDECEPPTLVGAESVVTHGALGEIALPIALAGDVMVDPRLDAGKKIVLYFEGALDPAVVENSANVLIIRASGGTIPASSIASNLDDTGLILTLTFPGLPGSKLADRDRYTIDLSAFAVDDSVFELALLAGDANQDGVVDPLDAGAVLSRFGAEVIEFALFDINNDGVAIDPLDAGAVLSRFGNAVP